MTNTPTRLRSALVLVGAASLGGLIAVQSRLLGEWGTQINDSYLASLVNFASGLLIMCVFVLLAPPARSGVASVFTKIRHRELPVWVLAGGPLGAFFAFNQAALTPIVGVALFTVGIVCGLVVGGLIADLRGFGPVGRIGPTRQRIVGVVLVLGGTMLASFPGLSFGWSSLLLVVPLIVGVGSAVQSALNGRVAVVSSSIAAAAFFNFLSGAILLAVGAGASVLMRGWPQQWPDSPVLYLVGIIGIVVISGISLLVRYGGVLLVGMSNVAGQLIGSILVDTFTPFGARPSLMLLIGATVVLIAVIVAAVPGRPRASRGPAI